MTIKPSYLLPDTVLFIYCLEGAVGDEKTASWHNFIGNWLEGGHSFLFFLEPADQIVSLLVRNDADLRFVENYTMTYGQWQGAEIEPFKIGKFVIAPPWIKTCSGNVERTIVLDSGIVFGNGTHPTTVDCLQAIEIVCSGGKIRRMLDLGTGTGLLALAAARLGCMSVVAVDYTLLAARTAKRNVILNGVEDQIAVVNAKAEDYICIPSDLLVANIGYDVLKEIISAEAFLHHTWFVLSGLLKTEADKITDLLKNRPVHLLKRWNTKSGWQTIMGITEKR